MTAPCSQLGLWDNNGTLTGFREGVAPTAWRAKPERLRDIKAHQKPPSFPQVSAFFSLNYVKLNERSARPHTCTTYSDLPPSYQQTPSANPLHPDQYDHLP